MPHISHFININTPVINLCPNLLDVTVANKSCVMYERGLQRFVKLRLLLCVSSAAWTEVWNGIFSTWFYYVSSIIWQDWHLTTLSVSDYVSMVGAFLILLRVKLHLPHSRSHRFMTRNSIDRLVMQWPSNIYIWAGFHCVWISQREPHKLTVVGWARKCHTTGLRLKSTSNCCLKCPHPLTMSSCEGKSAHVCLSLSLSQRTRSLMVSPPSTWGPS